MSTHTSRAAILFCLVHKSRGPVEWTMAELLKRLSDMAGEQTTKHYLGKDLGILKSEGFVESEELLKTKVCGYKLTAAGFAKARSHKFKPKPYQPPSPPPIPHKPTGLEVMKSLMEKGKSLDDALRIAMSKDGTSIPKLPKSMEHQQAKADVTRDAIADKILNIMRESDGKAVHMTMVRIMPKMNVSYHDARAAFGRLCRDGIISASTVKNERGTVWSLTELGRAS